MYWEVKESGFRLEMENSLIFINVKSMFTTGWGQGYVFLDIDHPWYGIHYNDLDNMLSDLDFYVHGGLTYSDYTQDKLYWCIGFDTGHSGDNLTNWSKEEVEKETKRLYDVCYSVYWKIDRKNKIKKFI
jgi:hypothetical protein